MIDEEEHDDTALKKKTYQRPTLIEIALRPDEAVLGNCKSSGASGPGGSGSCTHVGSCFSQGS